MTHEESPLPIRDYDATWPERYAALAPRAQKALGDIVRRIEHIGSTAVPGLAAKPIIDLDVVVSRSDVREAIRRLARLGYAHEGDLRTAGREAFRWPAGETPHHLYVVTEGGAELRRHVAFREALRADPALRERYAALKRSLAIQHSFDTKAYTEGKSVFIAVALSGTR